ncbi:hypothetical protein BH11ARM2_BH11ARM2_15850 [soil metagenome]
MKLFGKKTEEPIREEFPYEASLITTDGRQTILPPGATILGRTHDPDIGLAEDGEASRRHAVFEVSAAGVRVRDLGSRNGTFVNHEWVSVVWLKDADHVKIGDTELTFRLRKF